MALHFRSIERLGQLAQSNAAPGPGGEFEDRLAIRAKHNGGRAIPEPGTGQNGGHNGAASATPAAQMKFPPIVMPAGEPSESWWSQLVTGDNTREIAKETAIEICAIVVSGVLGPGIVQNTTIGFESELVTLRDLHSAIQDLTGPKGWSQLLKKAGHG